MCYVVDGEGSWNLKIIGGKAVVGGDYVVGRMIHCVLRPPWKQLDVDLRQHMGLKLMKSIQTIISKFWDF
jgi:hypothetical protein